jgi:hypothetical protein
MKVIIVFVAIVYDCLFMYLLHSHYVQHVRIFMYLLHIMYDT